MICKEKKVKKFNSINPRPVRCVDIGIVYRSCSEAGKVFWVGESNIRRCCDGKYATSGGVRWEWAED